MYVKEEMKDDDEKENNICRNSIPFLVSVCACACVCVRVYTLLGIELRAFALSYIPSPFLLLID